MSGANLTPSGLAPGLLLGEGVEIGEQVTFGGNVVVHAGARIGDRCLVGDHAQIRDRARIGSDTTIGAQSSIDPEVEIGERVSIQTACYLAIGTRVEDDVFLGPGVMVANDDTMGRPKPVRFSGAFFRRACRVGAGAVICPGVEIGEEAVVAAAALVRADVNRRGVVMGLPARQVREVPDEQLIENWR